MPEDDTEDSDCYLDQLPPIDSSSLGSPPDISGIAFEDVVLTGKFPLVLTVYDLT